MKLLFTLLLCSLTALAAADDAISISMIRLLADPGKFHGKRVWVTGYLHQKFEDSALYFSKEDADYLNGDNALWVSFGYGPTIKPAAEFDKNSKVALPAFDCRYVLIEGIVDTFERGHKGEFSGTIRDVSRVMEESRAVV